MWTTENRIRYDRSKLRYPSDLTDEEWAFIKPLIPPAKPRGQQTDDRCARGRQRFDVHPQHGVPMGVAAQGFATAQHGQRLLLPLEPRPDVGSHPSHALCAMPRTDRPRSEPNGGDHRQPERQECGKRGFSDPHGFDAGKKIKGKKRHILVDTQGLLMHSIVHAADIQDRDGGVMLMASIFGLFPFLLKLYADSGYTGPKFQLEQIPFIPAHIRLR